MSEDIFDRVERQSEARSRAAAEMAAVLGVDKDAEAGDHQPEDKSGSGPSVDAGERTPEDPPRGPTGAGRLRDFLLYDEAGWPRR
jgi:hypothetical protein